MYPVRLTGGNEFPVVNAMAVDAVLLLYTYRCARVRGIK